MDIFKAARALFRSLALAISSVISGAAYSQPIGATSFDAGWRFSRGDIASAGTPGFADGGWTQVDLPHDWAITGPFDQTAPATGSGAFLPTGVAWYRKHFTLPASAAGKRVFIECDGVMERSGVWINGHHIGHRPNGYSSFRYELTPHLKASAQYNVVAVRADTPRSRRRAGMPGRAFIVTSG